MKKRGVIFSGITGISFLFNLVWENVQAPLYAGYISFAQHFWICFVATLGDVVIVLMLYGLFAVAYRNTRWIMSMKKTSTALLIIAGAAIAVLIEWLALATGRWGYAPGMPLIPLFDVGVLPVLQLILLPLLTFGTTAKVAARYSP